MTILSANTPFTIQDSVSYTDDYVDLLILPEKIGSTALRELQYPSGTFDPIIYPDFPDKWENFDTTPLTARPLTDVQMTLAGNKACAWPGYSMDRPVKEYWQGTEQRSRMWLYFLRRLAEFFFNPPQSGYITWHPKDRTSVVYNVILESLTAGGADVLTYHYLGLGGDMVLGEIVLSFRIVGVV